MNVRPLLKQVITIARKTGYNAYREPTYGAQEQIPARVEAKQQLIRTRDGQEVVSDHEIVVLTDIGLEDRIWLPGTNPAKESDARKPRRVDKIPDIHGRSSMTVVYM